MSETSARFTEIAKAQISENKNLVFSETQQGTIVMAQQLVVKEGKKTHNIFLKGAIEVTSVDSLYQLRDAINACIRHVDGDKDCALVDDTEDGEDQEYRGHSPNINKL